jgi:Prokaryotic N-terminal methylation motif
VSQRVEPDRGIIRGLESAATEWENPSRLDHSPWRLAMRPTRSRRFGITLIEVLAAIFIMGVGLLALLTLFPLGALSMARAVQDDRAAAIAADAASLRDAGSELLMRTRQFVLISAIRGYADTKAAAGLRQEYENLGVIAANLDWSC